MKVRKALAFALAGILLGSGTVACGKQAHNYDLECDAGDQREHDTDCGYIQDGQWFWFSWVKQGETSYSPDNWEPPAGVALVEDEDEKPSPKKKTKKPVTDTRQKTNISKSNTNKTSTRATRK
jgi:hypothetical protein